MMLNRVKQAMESIAGTVTYAVAVTESSRPTPEPTSSHAVSESPKTSPEPTSSHSDPGPARRDPVIELLEANGGRVWQQDVVSELDCSAPSVSRLLSAMEADGEITRYWKRGKKVVASPALGPEAVAGYSDRERKQSA